MLSKHRISKKIGCNWKNLGIFKQAQSNISKNEISAKYSPNLTPSRPLSTTPHAPNRGLCDYGKIPFEEIYWQYYCADWPEA